MVHNEYLVKLGCSATDCLYYCKGWLPHELYIFCGMAIQTWVITHTSILSGAHDRPELATNQLFIPINATDYPGDPSVLSTFAWLCTIKILDTSMLCPEEKNTTHQASTTFQKMLFPRPTIDSTGRSLAEMCRENLVQGNLQNKLCSPKCFRI